MKNKKLLSEIIHLNSFEEKKAYLLPKQVENANICSESTFNPTDDFCLRCEWLPNCTLRKLRIEEKD
jgi:hypothetical protein